MPMPRRAGGDVRGRDGGLRASGWRGRWAIATFPRGVVLQSGDTFRVADCHRRQVGLAHGELLDTGGCVVAHGVKGLRSLRDIRCLSRIVELSSQGIGRRIKGPRQWCRRGWQRGGKQDLGVDGDGEPGVLELPRRADYRAYGGGVRGVARKQIDVVGLRVEEVVLAQDLIEVRAVARDGSGYAEIRDQTERDVRLLVVKVHVGAPCRSGVVSAHGCAAREPG